MPRYVIFNTINSDGVGDFTHFEDIMKVLLADPKYSDVEFIPIVYFFDSGKESNYVRIGKKMEALGIPYYYGKRDDHVRFSSDKALQKLLNKADQAIIISYSSIENSYLPYLKKGIPIKYIGEHESSTKYYSKGRHEQKSLGLSSACYGIKIQDSPHIPPNEAWDTINKSDPEFATQLLTSTNSPDFAVFREKNSVVPAYFNKGEDFIPFLNLFAINHSLDKDIVVYQSGGNLDHMFANYGTAAVGALFKESNIATIEVITPGNNQPIVLEGNPDGTQTMRIFTGFYVSDPTFNAMYQLSNFAGVSGDNTLERCVSMDILPYYWSTNEHNKRPTLQALKSITQLRELEISPEARESFKIFFDLDERIDHSNTSNSWIYGSNHSRNRVSKFPLLDFPKMIEAWPAVTAYLRQNKNFYKNLDGIVLEKLPIQAQPAACVKKTTMSDIYTEFRQAVFESKPKPGGSSDLKPPKT